MALNILWSRNVRVLKIQKFSSYAALPEVVDSDTVFTPTISGSGFLAGSNAPKICFLCFFQKKKKKKSSFRKYITYKEIFSIKFSTKMVSSLCLIKCIGTCLKLAEVGTLRVNANYI